MEKIFRKNKQDNKMKKEEFMSELENYLIGISKEDKKEILQDYEEHFRVGKRENRTEAEISKSLGSPKQIAREVRKELRKFSEVEDLKNEAIETFVVAKKLTKRVFRETKEKTIEIIDNFNHNEYGDRKILFWILGIFAFISLFAGFSGRGLFLIISLLIFAGLILAYSRNKNKKKKTSKRRIHGKEVKKSGKINILRLVLIILFNLIIFIGFWISLFFAILGILIASFVSILTGFVLIAFSIFGLIGYNNSNTIDILLSILFAGIGISIFSLLFTFVFRKILKGFFVLTKKYIELNSRFIRK